VLLVATTDSGKLVVVSSAYVPIYEVENEGLKRHFDDALPTDFTFLGENQRGDHVRVHYLPGALAPPLL
jgi:hypothetical protein